VLADPVIQDLIHRLRAVMAELRALRCAFEEVRAGLGAAGPGLRRAAAGPSAR
jgi:hypothetical protein